jgi:neutral ceramidase
MVKVGAAKLDITPDGECHLAGYAAREQPALGVHDSVYVKAVTFQCEAFTAAVVSCDLLGFEPAFSDCLRGRLTAEAGVAHAIITGTHTHSAPASMPLIGCGDVDPEGLEEIADRVMECARMAVRAAVPCRVKTGAGEARVGMNRRARVGEGTRLLTSGERRPFDDTPGPLDLTVGVVQLVDQHEKGAALLFNHACHAVCLGHDNRLISADYPGAAASVLEQEPDLGMPVFLQGACGDINPAVSSRDFEAAEAVGRAVAEATKEALSGRDTLPLTKLVFAERRLALPLRGVSEEVQASVCALAADSFAVVTMPGEAFVELGMTVRSASPFPVTLVAGYANGNIGYLPTRSAYPEGGYEVESAYTYYGYPAPAAPEAGEAVMSGVLECLKECKERLL